MIYAATLKRRDGTFRRHNGRPSRKFLKNHQEFISYHEAGHHNEYSYRTDFAIVDAKLVEVADHETHDRENNVPGY